MEFDGAQITGDARVAPDAPVDYRTVVGKQRRARTEARILEAALHVFAEKGPDAPVIDDFIKAAGIARGTFYNYFKSTPELLQATSNLLSDDIALMIETQVRHIKDPVLRHCTAMRLWARKAETDRAWCAFVARAWFRDGFAVYAPLRDIREGMKRGGFRCLSAKLGYDLSIGTMRQAMLRQVMQACPNPFEHAVVRVIMQGLGVESAAIDEMLGRPLPDMQWPARPL